MTLGKAYLHLTCFHVVITFIFVQVWLETSKLEYHYFVKEVSFYSKNKGLTVDWENKEHYKIDTVNMCNDNVFNCPDADRRND